ncbi:MAG TPA: YcxB family protein [Tepidisphaeraceae bacterium]|nr:YcxB family protein [Tepidisphaeraceae bacterium]
MKLSVRLTYADMLELNRIAPQSRMRTRLMMALGAAVVFTGFLVRLPDGSRAYAVVFWGAAFVLAGWLSPYLMAWGAYHLTDPNMLLDLEDDGLHVTAGGAVTTLPWDAFTCLRETTNLVVLAQGVTSQIAIAIPKKQVPDDQLDAFRALIARHMCRRQSMR